MGAIVNTEQAGVGVDRDEYTIGAQPVLAKRSSTVAIFVEHFNPVGVRERNAQVVSHCQSGKACSAVYA